MKRPLEATLISACLVLSSCVSAFADDFLTAATPPADPQNQTAPAAKPAKSGLGDSIKDSVTHFPQRFAAFAAGAVVGTPIAVVRKTISETQSGVTDVVGDGKNIFTYAAWVPLTIISLPYGAVSGVIQGSVLGPYNSLKNCADKPYSKESFSLGDMQ